VKLLHYILREELTKPERVRGYNALTFFYERITFSILIQACSHCILLPCILHYICLCFKSRMVSLSCLFSKQPCFM
jgi:hypothetical protein